MQFAKNRKAIAISIVLAITMVASIMLVPYTSAATAHTPAWEIKTFAYVQAVPGNVGVGEYTYIYTWLDKVFDSANMTNTYRFHNFKLTITAPDGTVEEKTFPYIADTTSSQGYSYKPTQTGTYMVNFTFPGQDVDAYDYNPDSAYQNDTYLPSSATCNFTVQADPIGNLPSSYPLPTEYWSRPIYGENTDWWSISSNWLGNGAPGYGGFASTYNYGGNGELFPDDAVGPMTSHIMWTKELQSGGVVGGDNYEIDGNTYFEGSAYIQRYQNPIIVNGKIYYTEPNGYSSASGGPTVCVDLRTGELIWSKTDVPALSFAWIPDYENPNQHGVYNAMLVAVSGTTWRVFDADTGNALFNVTNVPSGRKAMGPNGEIMIYGVQNAGNDTNPDYRLFEWNSTKLWSWSGNTPSITSAVDASVATRYNYNASISWANTMPLFKMSVFGTEMMSTIPFNIVEAYYGDMMLCYNTTLPSTGGTMFFGLKSDQPYTYFAINLNASKGTVGTILWSKTYDAPDSNVTVLQAGVDPVNRIFVENYRETMQYVGYDLDTGEQLWGPTDSQVALDYYGSPASGSLSNAFYQGRMYTSGYGGVVYCYDTTDGDLLWTYGNGGAGNSTDSGFAVPGNYPTFVSAFGNGVVYLVTTEHTIETPLYKGSLHRALNATTGEEIWTLNSYTGEFMTTSYAIADGYATWFNGLDNQIYVVGRGSSQTTVSGPTTASDFGDPIVIQGTVIDTSSGTTQDEQAARFPSGVPVSSDKSMKDWMGYVYQQKPMPSNFTGVEVSISVVDSNGNYRNIGTATTDASGRYSFEWTPDIAGKYTVIASFQGTNGYWPSYSETAFTVAQAGPTASPYPTVSLPPTELYFAASTIAIIAAIAVIGMLILKKKA